MNIQDIYNWIDSFAPFDTQESFDNSGLIIGDYNKNIKRVFFTLDVTNKTIEEAVNFKADLIVSHHPLMFGGIHHLHYSVPESFAISNLIKEDIALISAHTNFDKATDGTGYNLGIALDLSNLTSVNESDYLFVGELTIPLVSKEFLKLIDNNLNTKTRFYGNENKLIKSVAVGAGALGEEINIVAKNNIDAYVVGEIKHHQIIASQEYNISLFDAGHFSTEQPGIKYLCDKFKTFVLSNNIDLEIKLSSNASYSCITNYYKFCYKQ